MPNFRVECSISAGAFLAGLGTDEVDNYNEFDFFPYPVDTVDVFVGFDVVGPTDDPVGSELTPAMNEAPASDRLLDRFREPTPDEYQSGLEFGGISVSGSGTCLAVVAADSDALITDDIVLAALPKRCHVVDIENFTAGMNNEL